MALTNEQIEARLRECDRHTIAALTAKIEAVESRMKMMERAMADTKLSATDIRVLVVVFDSIGRVTKGTNITTRRVSDSLLISPASVRSSIARLIGRGHLLRPDQTKPPKLAYGSP